MAKEGNVIREKSYAFALRMVRVYQHLSKAQQEYVLSKQLLRCGTSIGANVEEGIGAQSEKDFIARFQIAYKEARETRYWLCLLRDSSYLTEQAAISLLHDCEELLNILSSNLKTMKAKSTSQNS